METQPGHHPLKVVPHRVRAEPEPLGDVGIGESLRREQGDLRLAGSSVPAAARLVTSR